MRNPLQAAAAAGRRGDRVLRWYRRSGQDLIDRHVIDPLLKAILAGQSGDHGQPPAEVSAFVHAGLVRHYYNGGYFPRGGGFAIPRAFVRALKRAGGELRLETAVARILIEDGRAVGVELADGEQIRATAVISNADPEVTFGKLIGREHLPGRLRGQARSRRPTPAPASASSSPWTWTCAPPVSTPATSGSMTMRT